MTTRRGFTLIELLTTTAIIGLVSVAGTAAYGLVRAKARDTKRVSDIRTIRNAIETYFEQNGGYPAADHGGLVLGSDEAKMISDAGITPYGRQAGITYLQNVPFNVLPHGVPYVYISKNKDGSLCQEKCASYEVSFELETPTGELVGGPHLLTEEGVKGAETGESGISNFQAFVSYLPSVEQLGAAFGSAQEVATLARTAADRPEVQSANQLLVAPASFVGAAASVAAAISAAVPAGGLGSFAVYLFTQPFIFLARRKRERWGVVYHSGTKVPIDLATVRLIDAKTGRSVATKVTDKDGRFAFAPRAGEYRLEVVKPGFAFPSATLANVASDGPFTDIYHGTLLRVAAGGETLTVNVPIDSEKDQAAEPRELLSELNKKSLRKAAALFGPSLGAVALAVSPSIKMLLLFLLHLFMYQLFKRLAEPPAPAAQGVVHDVDSRRPIVGAVVRVLSLPYHKVLETKLTDAQGRYAFNVGAGKFYLTAMKQGYEKTETDEIDFTKNLKPAWIASDLPMRRAPQG